MKKIYSQLSADFLPMWWYSAVQSISGALSGESKIIKEAVRAGVTAYIDDGASNHHRVKSILEVALARFKESQALYEELNKTKALLEERKIIEKAKGVIMKQRGMCENEAYHALRKMAMERNQRIAEVSHSVITVANLLG